MKTGHLRTLIVTSWTSFLLAVLMPERVIAAGSWQKLANSAPDSVELMLLLSDGTVMAANNPASISAAIGNAWYCLTPDPFGHYANGDWSSRASMNNTRLFYSSQVLTDGRVFVAGGEYGTGGASAEVYDPLANSWTLVNPPNSLINPSQGDGFIDSESIMLPGGKVLVHPVIPATNNATVIYDPVANIWSAAALTLANQDESSWVKLPDGSILTVDADSSSSERYIPALNRWIPDANLPVSIWASLGPNYVGETGPALLLPNGKAFFLGGNGNTAIYTPSGSTNLGSWVAGPVIPNGLGSADAPAAMMPNGKILCAVAGLPSLDSSGTPQFPSPTSFFEYDYTVGATGSFTQVSGPTGTTDNISSYQSAMLVLPDGSVLYCHVEQGNLFYSSFGSQLYIYVPDGTPVASGKPLITGITGNSDGSFTLTGKGFNGISQGAAYGDDAQMDCNYPIVLITDNNNNHADYARTFNWSSTGVMTGNAVVTTQFTVPAGLLPQSYSLTVIGSGISSDAVAFNAPLWVDFNYTGATQTGSYANPYKTIAQGVNAVLTGEQIFIKPGHSTETLTISKPVTITSIGGTATIGQ